MDCSWCGRLEGADIFQESFILLRVLICVFGAGKVVAVMTWLVSPPCLMPVSLSLNYSYSNYMSRDSVDYSRWCLVCAGTFSEIFIILRDLLQKIQCFFSETRPLLGHFCRNLFCPPEKSTFFWIAKLVKNLQISKEKKIMWNFSHMGGGVSTKNFTPKKWPKCF